MSEFGVDLWEMQERTKRLGIVIGIVGAVLVLAAALALLRNKTNRIADCEDAWDEVTAGDLVDNHPILDETWCSDYITGRHKRGWVP